jgi:hypothetical protein
MAMSAWSSWLFNPTEYQKWLQQLRVHLKNFQGETSKWMTELIKFWFEIDEPRGFQVHQQTRNRSQTPGLLEGPRCSGADSEFADVDCALYIMKRQDVFLTSKTGSGKSIVMLAPIIGNQVLSRQFLTICCYLTMALMNDQVSQNAVSSS